MEFLVRKNLRRWFKKQLNPIRKKQVGQKTLEAHAAEETQASKPVANDDQKEKKGNERREKTVKKKKAQRVEVSIEFLSYKIVKGGVEFTTTETELARLKLLVNSFVEAATKYSQELSQVNKVVFGISPIRRKFR